MKQKIITLKEFFERFNKYKQRHKKLTFIYCKTREQAEILFRAFDKLGHTWLGINGIDTGKSYLETDDDQWYYFNTRNCFGNNGTVADVFTAQWYGTVYDFEDVILEEEL